MNKKVLTPILALLVLSTIPSVMAGGVRARGKPLEIVRLEIPYTADPWFPCDVGWCWGSMEGFLVVHVFEGYELIVYHIENTFWNNVTMKGFSGPSIGPAMVDYEEGTFVGIGIWFMARQHGGPPLVLDVGKIVFDLETEEVIEAHGRHDLSDEAFCDQLCSLIEEYGSPIDG